MCRRTRLPSALSLISTTLVCLRTAPKQTNKQQVSLSYSFYLYRIICISIVFFIGKSYYVSLSYNLIIWEHVVLFLKTSIIVGGTITDTSSHRLEFIDTSNLDMVEFISKYLSLNVCLL